MAKKLQPYEVTGMIRGHQRGDIIRLEGEPTGVYVGRVKAVREVESDGPDTDAMLAEAQAKIDKVVADAEAKAEQIIADAEAKADKIVKDAEAKAGEIVAEAQAKADKIVKDAETPPPPPASGAAKPK